MRIKVSVTQADIDSAKRRKKYWCPWSCPVAKALRRRTGKKWAAGLGYLRVAGLTIDTPTLVRSFIKDFDAERDIKPIEFTIDVPKCFVK